MKQLLSLSLVAIALVCAPPSPRCEDAPTTEEGYHDPLAALAQKTDDVGRSLLGAYEHFDLVTLQESIAAIEARLGTDAELDEDRYVVAQGYVSLALMRRFYEKQAPDDMPAALEQLDPDEISEAGIAHAQVYEQAHPDHADIKRVHGELVSTQIRGMLGGMTKGPEAKRIMAQARELDPRNGWVHFSSARMHYHNPAFVGGDKDLALEELRELQKSMEPFRVRLYLALVYNAKEMYPQARFWALKAKAVAPENPELALLLTEIKQRLAERAAEQGERAS